MTNRIDRTGWRARLQRWLTTPLMLMSMTLTLGLAACATPTGTTATPPTAAVMVEEIGRAHV